MLQENRVCDLRNPAFKPDNLLYGVVVIITFLFAVIQYAAIITVFYTAILVYVLFRNRLIMHLNSFMYLITLMMGMILFQIVFLNNTMLFNSGFAVKELSRLVIYLLIFLVIMNINVDFDCMYKLWVALLYLSLIIQVIQFTKVIMIDDWLRLIYGESQGIDMTVAYSTMEYFRSGALFLNCNQYIKFALLVYCIILQKIEIDYLQGQRLGVIRHLTPVAAVFASIVFSGSRTGFIIFALISIAFAAYFLSMSFPRLSMKGFIAVVITSAVMVIICLGIIIAFSGRIAGLMKDFRIFHILLGLDTSMAYKSNTFLNLIEDAGIGNLLLGFGVFDTSGWESTLIDFDLGYMISFFGVFGLFFYCLLIVSILSKNRCEGSVFHIIHYGAIAVIIFSSLSSGVFLNLRVFSVMICALFVKKQIRSCIKRNGIDRYERNT
ncbi:MAG: hypothetical protein N3I35_05825 [Clostridia bacterium]|nr:hypothetical protein [Clostridia bacterium]